MPLTNKFRTRLTIKTIVLIFIPLSLGIIALFTLGFYFEKDKIKKDKLQEISTIADLKISEIASWREERFKDACGIKADPVVRHALRQWKHSPCDKRLSADIRGWMNAVQVSGNYAGIALVDESGNLQMSAGVDSLKDDSTHAISLRKAFSTDSVVLTDLHRLTQAADVHMDMIIPIRLQDLPVNKPSGSLAIILEIDPARFLYPLVQSWPVPNISGETLLLRGEGDHLVYLNKLRYRDDAPLTFTLPLTQPDLVGVKAFKIDSGILEGVDYRGVPVLGAARLVPGTAWHMVAKMDKNELFAPIRLLFLVMAAFASGLIALAAIAIGLTFNMRSMRQMKAIIAERKRSEEKIAAEHERLLVTLRSIGDGVIVTNVSGAVTLMNKVAEDLTGWKLLEAVNRPLAEVFNIINELTRAPCENPVEKVLMAGGIVELANHTALIRRDGKERVIEDSAAPVRNNAGELIGVVLVFRDTTEKHKLEEAVQTSQRLESLGLIAGGLAHDFNNLLFGISGYVDMARSFAEEGGSHQAFQTLAKTNKLFERAKNLSNKLLTFAKGGTPVRKIQFVGSLIAECVEFNLGGSNVSPNLSIAEDLWCCDIDENQIVQALQNIVINARQAMPAGGNLDVAASNLTPDKTPAPLPRGPYVMISIRDYGSGISPELLPRIFDPFFTTKPDGSGLGLAISYSIIKKHGGHIGVESAKNAGMTFHIYLPATSGKVTVAMPKQETPAYPEPVHPSGQGKILVMDDEPYIREIVKTVLSELGYMVVEARDGDEAINLENEAWMSGDGFNCAILDLTIPGGRGGTDIVQNLRAIDPLLVIIASSGYSQNPVLANPTDYGFTAGLIKPYKLDELKVVITGLVKPNAAI